MSWSCVPLVTWATVHFVLIFHHISWYFCVSGLCNVNVKCYVYCILYTASFFSSRSTESPPIHSLFIGSAGAAGDVRSSAWSISGPSSLFFSENRFVRGCFISYHLPLWYVLKIIQKNIALELRQVTRVEHGTALRHGFPKAFSMLEAATEPGTPCRSPWLWIWRPLLPVFGVQTSCNCKLKKWRRSAATGQGIGHNVA